MRHLSHVLAALVMVVSCAGAPPHLQAAPRTPVVRVWIATDSDVAPKDVLAGCASWAPAGLRCVRVAEPAQAAIKVTFSHEPCLSLARKRIAELKAGRYLWHTRLRPECTIAYPADDKIDETWGMVGLSTGSGAIELYPACIAWSGGGVIKPDIVRLTAAHEFGHQFGIAHVPVSCNDPCVEYATDASGAKVCGLSVMNSPLPPITVLATGLTPADLAAFGVHAPAIDPLR